MVQEVYSTKFSEQSESDDDEVKDDCPAKIQRATDIMEEITDIGRFISASFQQTNVPWKDENIRKQTKKG